VQIEVQMFAAARQAAQSHTIQVEVPDQAIASDVIAEIGRVLPEIAGLLPSCRLAIDNRYVAGDANVSQQGEVALIPPVSGG